MGNYSTPIQLCQLPFGYQNLLSNMFACQRCEIFRISEVNVSEMTFRISFRISERLFGYVMTLRLQRYGQNFMRYLWRRKIKFYVRYTKYRMAFFRFFNIAAIHCQIHDFLCPGRAYKTIIEIADYIYLKCYSTIVESLPKMLDFSFLY